MIRSILICALLLASVWLGVQLHLDPGYVLIAVHHWTIESTLTVAILGLSLFFLMLHGLLLLLHWMAHIPQSWTRWRALRRAHHAQENTRQGLIEFSEGHWLRARNHLINALPDTDRPLLNYLTAARAAQEMGDSKLRDDYLREAQQSMPEAKIAVELTQAQLQLANRQWEQALATLRHLQDLSPHHPYVLKLLMHLYEEVKDWPQLIALLPALRRHDVVSEEAFVRLQRHAYLQALQDLIRQRQPEAITALVTALPKVLVNDPEIMAEYCQFLLNTQDETQAESILRRCLQKQFDDPLIMLYGQIKQNKNQLNFAESLLKKNPHSASLYLCLSRICKSHQLWGKAKTYIDASIECTPTPEAYAELGALLEELDDKLAACEAYRHGLLLATTLQK
ncbi:MAG TPA: protoporphyrinogen oxidase [Legionella sp.]|nr:protoporphyrinogen oxidase [Legionella sp.]